MTIIQFPGKNKQCCATHKSHIVLPVCPKANVRIRFDAQKKIASAVPLDGALNWLKEIHAQGTTIKSIMIAGPGDPLASPELTLKITESILSNYPDIQLGISTLGLCSKSFADEITKSGISNISLLVNAVNIDIIQNIYAWIRPATKNLPILQASELLVNSQKRAVEFYKEKGLHVSIETTVFPGINDRHIETIAQTMASLGSDTMTLIPYETSDSDYVESPKEADEKLMKQILQTISRYFQYVSIFNHKFFAAETPYGSLAINCPPKEILLPKPSKERPNIAVVSSNGMEIDLHLGHAYQVLIYGPREDGLPCLLETRPAPEPGGGGLRWEVLAEKLNDCFALLCASAGENPKKIMVQHGVSVLTNEGEIEGTVDALFGGGKKCKKK